MKSSASMPDSARKRELYERLKNLGVKVAEIQRWDLPEDQLSDLVERLEKLLSSVELKRDE